MGIHVSYLDMYLSFFLLVITPTVIVLQSVVSFLSLLKRIDRLLQFDRSPFVNT